MDKAVHVYQPVDTDEYVDRSSSSECDGLEKRENIPLIWSSGVRKDFVRCRPWIIGATFVLYSILLVYATVVIRKHTTDVASCFLPQGIPSIVDPAYVELRDKPEMHSNHEKSQNQEFFGEPNDYIEDNWVDLMEYSSIRIPPRLMRELDRPEKEGVKLADGTYFGSLMVWHQLHCLYPQYFNLTTNKMTLLGPDGSGPVIRTHIAHCLHTLKQWVMCRPDLTVVTARWDDDYDYLLPAGNFSTPHQCVNWDRFQEWSKQISFDATEDGALVHPKFGPVIINGTFQEKDYVNI